MFIMRQASCPYRYSSSRRHLSGFTLIELLVVLLIAALSAATVSFSISSRSNDSLVEAGQLLFDQMQFALDDALLSQRVVGLQITNQKDEPVEYRWQRYDNEQWSDLDNAFLEGIFKAVTLPEEWALTLDTDTELAQALAEQALNTTSSTDSDIASDTLAPSIVFYPDGEVSEFRLQLSFKNDSATTDSSNNGQTFQITLNEYGELEAGLLDKSGKEVNL